MVTANPCGQSFLLRIEIIKLIRAPDISEKTLYLTISYFFYIKNFLLKLNFLRKRKLRSFSAVKNHNSKN